MLGSQSWAVALSIPAFLIGGYVASRKRLAYQWREELMDMDGGIYSTVCDDDMRHFCRVLPRREFATSRATPRAPSIKLDAPHDANRHDGANDGDGETCRVRPLTPKENIGLYVRRDAITPECGAVLLTEIRRLARTVGSALDARKVQSFRWRAEMHAHDCGADSLVRATNARHPLRNQTAVLQGERVPQADGAEEEESVMDASFYEHIRVISDHAEDTQAMHAPWGCGDRLDLSKMPSYLRGLVAHMQRHFENVGRLRHVYIEYSPTGNFFREPRSPSGYDGHDYLLLALRRDGAGTVITMSPNTRSRYPRLDEVRRYSWTSYDVDALLPAQCVLRVYGSARYDYGWGVRPGRVWFGSWHNPVPRAMPSSCLVACSSKGEKGRAVHVATEAVRRRLIDWMGSSRALSRVWHARRPHPRDGEAATSPSLPSGSEELSLRHEAAMVVLHFEGPRSQKGQRSLLLHPEALIFGRAPTPEVFETWVDDTPTPQSVREEGLIHFIVHNYSNMWAAS